MVETDEGWKAFEIGTYGLHFCSKRDNWSLSSLGHRLTCTIRCWWCRETVYFHTNGNGDAVLFEKLGAPWEIHPCWEKHKHSRSAKIKELESILKQAGYDGRSKQFNLLKRRKHDPYIKMILQSKDMRVLDNYLIDFCKCLVSNDISFKGPIPMNVKINNGVKIYKRIIKILTASAIKDIDCFKEMIPPSINIKLKII
ncbi:hypothetical protein [Hydrogenimonas urashimensis]|uniref:hypothetical protein n=1 Tax=Hydrogenimonas urashimensis TaxID=2740515 RepID=UPI00191640FD|nr:hypothetical protein [Hydrogenimonas urashimensis]